MRRVFIGKDIAYGSSKGSATVETAATPYDLREGALGLYGISASTNKLILITEANAGAFAGEQVVFAVGLASGNDNSIAFDVAGIKVSPQAYRAAVKQVITVGYSTTETAGTLNLPTISKNDEGLIIVKDNADLDQAPQVGKSYSGYADKDSAAIYDILADLADRVNGDANSDVKVDVYIKGTNTNVATGAATADPTLVNGSKNVTFAADPGIGVGDILLIRGVAYKVAVENSATDYDLDRVYEGASETIDISGGVLLQTVASVTDGGFTITDKSVNQATVVALDGIFADATKVVTTAAVTSIGSGADVKKMEENKLFAFGQHNQRDRVVPLKGLLVDESENYDLHIVSGTNSRHTSDPHNDGKSNNAVEIVLATPAASGDAATDNQSRIEDILNLLGVSFTHLASA